MSPIQMDNRVVRRDHIVANDLSAGQTVMLDVDAGQYFGVEHVAKDIWDALATPIEVDALCRRLLERYDVDEATCHREVVDFLEELTSQGLIDVHRGEGARE